MPGLLDAIPNWLPPARMFWAYVTTLGFFAAAIAILTGIMAPLASRLLTAEIVIFELLFWIPNLYAAPRNHFNWSANAISFALIGAAWVVSDSISAEAETKPIAAESHDAPLPRAAVRGATSLSLAKERYNHTTLQPGKFETDKMPPS
jgi:hypothetical protein